MLDLFVGIAIAILSINAIFVDHKYNNLKNKIKKLEKK